MSVVKGVVVLGLAVALQVQILGAAEDQPVAQVKLVEAKLDETVWEKGTGGEPHAAIKPGKVGAVPLPAWWGEGSRPPEGSAWLAEVRFQDIAQAPIVVQLFAGLPGREEVHRIGGLGDGAWKTALVPLPWDLVMRAPGKDGTELSLSAPQAAALPVAWVKVVKGDAAADEARWADETRAWVARVQEAKRKAAKLPEPQSASLPEAWKDKPLVPFARSTARLIATSAAPQDGEAGAPVRMKLALNETEPAQLGVYANGAELKNVSLALGDGGLANEAGAKLDAEVELFAAEYSVTGKGQLFPQRFWPAYPVATIPAGASHLFWVNVTTRGAGAPGTYRGTLRIAAEGQAEAAVPLEVEVLPITLLGMTEAGLHMGGCTVGLLCDHELRFIAKHNHNSINLWFSGVQPGIVRKSATEFDLDFTVLDDFMKRAKAAGIDNFVYFLGGDPYGFPDTLSLERELYRQVHFEGDSMAGRKEFIVRTCEAKEKLIPELRALYKQWVEKLMKHAEEAGWPEPLLTPFDEPAKWVQENWAKADVYYAKDKDGPWHTVAKVKAKEKDAFLKEHAEKGRLVEHWGVGGAGPWIKGHFKDACAAIHEAWPKARIYGSIHHAVPGLPFLDDIEIFCTNAIHEDTKLGDKVRAGGPSKTFWQYSGGGDDRSVAEGRYSYGFFFGAFDSRGSLCWAYNWGNRFDTSAGSNWLYAWTTPYGVVRAPYLEGVREAWDDRRYIETLRARAKAKGEAAAKDAEALLNEIFDAAVKSRNEGGRGTVSDFFARSNDPDALDTMREKIAAKIVELQK
ncbi:MAG: hypothetical protein M5U26_02050 [Planctomycetota bacterium]|nr:hypothetical protein [Planctomycetota bacterium]